MKAIPDKINGDTLSPFEYNSTQEENENVVLSAGLILDASGSGDPDPDTNQLSRSITRYASGADFYACTGISPLYILSQNLTFKTADNYFDGMKVRFLAYFDNGADPQINVNSFGARDLVFMDESEIPSGYILTNNYIEAIYIGTPSTGKFRLITTFPDRHLVSLGVRFEHRENLGTAGGPINGTGLRPITDIVYNNVPGFTINTGTNSFIPSAGKYFVECEQVFTDFNGGITWLNNVTQSDTPIAFAFGMTQWEDIKAANVPFIIKEILDFNGADTINIKVKIAQDTVDERNLGKATNLTPLPKEFYMKTTFTKIIS
jgi:hypothetical protein